jgi:hypothetical protein
MDRPNIAAILKQVRGKGMPKGMATDAFYQPGSGNRFFYGPLKQSFMNMMSPFLSGFDILPTIFLSRRSSAPPTTTSRRSSTTSRSGCRARCLEAPAEFVHFACTSEDINNLAYA